MKIVWLKIAISAELRKDSLNKNLLDKLKF